MQARVGALLSRGLLGHHASHAPAQRPDAGAVTQMPRPSQHSHIHTSSVASLSACPPSTSSHCPTATPARRRQSARASAISMPAIPVQEEPADCSTIMRRLHNPASLRSSIGLPLTDEEQRALLLCLHSANLGVETCLSAGLEALFDHVMAFMEHTASTHEEDLQVVEGAMLLLEQLSLSLGTCRMADDDAPVARGLPVGSEPALQGRWQLVVTTAGSWPQRLQYIPVLEFFEVMPDLSHFRLDTKLGPLYLSFCGELEWLTCDYLHYHVTDVKLEVVGANWGLPTSIPDNDLRIFARAGDIAIARSAGGGLLLMQRPI